MSSRHSREHDDIDITRCDAIRPRFQVVNVESSHERFPDLEGPSIATWRCNLVAASQRRNLVFTAHLQDIYVWIPNGPYQVLGSQAEMIIRPVMKDSLGDGYIDPASPHCINNIIVDDLGFDEILLLVTDSGNVCGYYVERIFSAVSRCQKNGGMRPFCSPDVNPFFVESVAMSAWGLAVHKFARLIAVSSNTGDITVFAFALVGSSSMESDNLRHAQHSPSDQTWICIETNEQLRDIQARIPYKHRSQNLRLTYRGHYTNIPSVSFANFGLDSCGTWMVSTDTRGILIVWKVWESLGPYSGVDIDSHFQGIGWTVLPLDPRTFKRHKSLIHAHGFAGATCDSFSRVNLRTSLERDPEWFSGLDHNSFSPISLPDDIFSPEGFINHDLQLDNVENFDQTIPSYASQSANDDAHIGLKSSEDINEDNTGNPFGTADSSQKHQHLHRLRCKWSLHDADYWTAHVSSPIEDNDFYRSPLHPRAVEFFPLLHFSATHITLIPYLNHPHRLTCASALRQSNYPYGSLINRETDRFCMIKYVPELGLVVAATQKGRAAVISLTQHKNFGYSFRTDWIAPFIFQEERGDRPFVPLHGIAVCPMQGFETPPDVSYIPPYVDSHDCRSFRYRKLASDGFPSNSSFPPSNSSPSVPIPYEEYSSIHTQPSSTSHGQPSDISLGSGSETESCHYPRQLPTLPERHAQATLNHRPAERWHGSHPSRHYRLFLIYYDHTVMTYEFWHDWVR